MLKTRAARVCLLAVHVAAGLCGVLRHWHSHPLSEVPPCAHAWRQAVAHALLPDCSLQATVGSQTLAQHLSPDGVISLGCS